MEYVYGTTLTTGTSGTWTLPATIGNGNYMYGGGGAGGGGAGGGYSAPAPRPQTALEWLDAEIEAVCMLARIPG